MYDIFSIVKQLILSINLQLNLTTERMDERIKVSGLLSQQRSSVIPTANVSSTKQGDAS